MSEAIATTANTPKPLGNFEIAPELDDEKHPLDVIYEHSFICRADQNGSITIRSQLLRGVTQPQDYVDVCAVDHTHQTVCHLACSPEQARAIATALLTAADDAETAKATQAAH